MVMSARNEGNRPKNCLPVHRLDRGSPSFTACDLKKPPELAEIRGRINALLIQARSNRALFEGLAFYGGGLADRIQQIYDGRGAPPTEDELAGLGKSLDLVEDWRGEPRPKWMKS
jgi:hypothetical protein